jgi:hypothetical protein
VQQVEDFERFDRARGLEHPIARFGEDPEGETPDHARIVHDQDGPNEGKGRIRLAGAAVFHRYRRPGDWDG